MNDLCKLTRIILVGLAVYLLISALGVLCWTLPQFVIYRPGYLRYIIPNLLSSLFAVAYSVLIIYVLLYKGDFLARKIVGPEDSSGPGPKVFWVPVAFRLASVFAGILYLNWAVGNIISSTHSHIIAKRADVHIPYAELSAVQIISWLILLGLSLYLLCGAPHFVRWQVKKILEECKLPPQPESSTQE